MGLFKSKEEKEAIAKERKAKQEELAKKLEATRLEKQRIEKDYQLKLAEVGLTKMMANSEVYNEIMVIQNDTIINMLAQIVLSNQNLMSAGFAAAERERHNNKINDTLRQNHLNNLK